MKRYTMTGPGGISIETTASSIEKAWNNIRYRLHAQFHLSWWAANHFDNSDLHEVV